MLSLALGFTAGALVVVIWGKYFPMPTVWDADAKIKLSRARFCEQASWVFGFLLAVHVHYFLKPSWASFGQAAIYLGAGLVGALLGFACFEDLFEDLSEKIKESN